MVLNISILVFAVACGLGFLVFISLAILNRLDAYRLGIKEKI